MKPEDLMEQVTFSMELPILEKFKALVKRRYGDDSDENRNKVVEDAIRWQLDQWNSRDNYGLYDWFWTTIAFHCPFSKLKAIGWTKLFLVRYLE
jgi:hypothetical protein